MAVFYLIQTIPSLCMLLHLLLELRSRNVSLSSIDDPLCTASRAAPAEYTLHASCARNDFWRSSSLDGSSWAY